MTNMAQLNAALHHAGTRTATGMYYASARLAAKYAAEIIGARWLGDSLVVTDECVCEVVVNGRHNVAWAREAVCPEQWS